MAAKKSKAKKKPKVEKKPKAEKKDRGKIYEVNLSSPITLNGNTVTKAIIELDHINFGVNEDTGELNGKRRLNFTLSDIKRFIAELDQEDIPAKKHDGYWSLFITRVDSPIRNKHEGKEFIMVFKLNYRESELIHTITLYPGW